MNKLIRKVATTLLLACLTLPIIAKADADIAKRLGLEAKEALDAHFGNPEQLALAARLLTRALEESKDDPTIYVQAARLTVKGGYVVSTQFQPGTLEAYAELLDRALALDPNNAEARMLKSEYFRQMGDFPAALTELDRAKSTGTKNVWLFVDYGKLYQRMGDDEKALRYYSEARVSGPGTSTSQRNAYIVALNSLAVIEASSGDEKELAKLIVETRSGRDSRDAWALGNLAESLIRVGMFDDAISLSREALQTMSYGAGRLTLAAALFGKAAELTQAGSDTGADKLLKEAHGYGFDKSSVLSRFEFASTKVNRLLPTLEAHLE